MRLIRSLSILCLLSLGACAQPMACACPAVGTPLLIVAPQSLQFPSVSATPAALGFEYGSVNGSRVTESDTCGTGSSRIVELGAFDVTSSGSATQTVTPTSPGTCVLHYSNVTTGTAVSITVR